MASTQSNIIDYLQRHPGKSSKEIHDQFASETSYASIKRVLTQLLEAKLIISTGKGRSTRYSLAPGYQLLYPIDQKEYFSKEIDERTIQRNFNFEVFDLLYNTSIFTDDELSFLQALQLKFTEKIAQLSPSAYNKEMERLAIDLSWKSSQIEGNTYSLLETERLLKDKLTADGKTKDEASMLLNHKEAIDFLISNPDFLHPLTRAAIENIHSMLTQELNIERNVRSTRIGISGTNYTPLDLEFQILEAIDMACNVINKKENIFEKALLAILLISYIQPFTDGNKRTGRIVSTAILLNYKYCPISFRTIDSVKYKEAMLIFYECNNLSNFKRIFIEQFEFAVNTYF